eukprot:gene21929-biopygen5703
MFPLQLRLKCCDCTLEKTVAGFAALLQLLVCRLSELVVLVWACVRAGAGGEAGLRRCRGEQKPLGHRWAGRAQGGAERDFAISCSSECSEGPRDPPAKRSVSTSLTVAPAQKGEERKRARTGRGHWVPGDALNSPESDQTPLRVRGWFGKLRCGSGNFTGVRELVVRVRELVVRVR